MAMAKNNKQQCKKPAKERLREFWEVFSKEDTVLVIINADPDALATALAVKRLLRYKAKSVTIAYPNEIRRLSNVAMVDILKIPAVRLHTLNPDDFSKKILLDSQPTHLPEFKDIIFDVVIDHHPVTDDWQAQYVDIRPDYGATASMIIEYLRAASMKPSVVLSTALFYAIKVDTRNFEKKASPADAVSFRYIFTKANKNMIRKIEMSELRPSELKYFRTALKDMHISKRRLYVHVGNVRNPDILVIIADFFNQVNQVSWVFVSGIHLDKLVVIFRCDGFKKNAGKLAARIFGELGSAGGHPEAARAEVPLENLGKNDQPFETKTLMRIARRHF